MNKRRSSEHGPSARLGILVTEYTFLLLNLAVGFYNAGIIWAHEIDIFRSWKLVGVQDFHRVQAVHWHKLPYWVFTPVGLALIGAFVLVAYHPAGSPVWAIGANLGCQVLALVLTGIFWGRWQARLSRDPAGPRSRYLETILRTHWLRTLLINGSALSLLLWTAAVH